MGHAGGNVDVEALDGLEEVVELDASLLDRLGRSGEADLDLLAEAGGGGGNRIGRLGLRLVAPVAARQVPRAEVGVAALWADPIEIVCPAAAASMTASMGGRVAAARTVG